MIKRALNFDRQDWKHMKFLFLNMLKQFFIELNWHEAKEAYIWMKIHLSYDSSFVEDDKDDSQN